jgi:hypothetical protein
MEKTIARRAFLKGATLAIGATMAGLSSAAFTNSAAARKKVGPALTLQFWGDERFTDASHVKGDPDLTQVRITLHAQGVGALRYIDSIHFVDVAGTVTEVPFHAWTASGDVGRVARFTNAVDPKEGLLLRVYDATGSTDIRFGSKGSGIGLREGIYVLAPSGANFAAYSYNPHDKRDPLGTGGALQYVVFSIESL